VRSKKHKSQWYTLRKKKLEPSVDPLRDDGDAHGVDEIEVYGSIRNARWCLDHVISIVIEESAR
jgi:hypothetical protein